MRSTSIGPLGEWILKDLEARRRLFPIRIEHLLTKCRLSLFALHRVITLEQFMDVTLSSASSTRDLTEITDDLARAFLVPADRGEMRRLLLDLCTPAEVRTLAERWHVARLLDGTDLSYREIHEATGVSTTTIVRVARFLRQEPNQGYRRTLDALQASDAS